MKRVIIVAEGQWGYMKPEDYIEQIERYRRILDEAEVPCSRKPGEKEKAAEVMVVKTAQEAEKLLKEKTIDVAVFVSREMGYAAEKMAAENMRTRVLVLTGLIPPGKVVWVDKGWFLGRKELERILLHTAI